MRACLAGADELPGDQLRREDVRQRADVLRHRGGEVPHLHGDLLAHADHALELVDGALGEGPAAVHDHDAGADLLDLLHVMAGYQSDTGIRYSLCQPDRVEIFSEVESDPSFETVNRGLELMNNFKPDVIIALGGGSAIDAAKGMWLFYEHPDADAEGLKLKFMDIRKRTYKFPKLGVKAKMVAIPTTSGTGSEVTSFAVLTDKVKNKKYPLADYELTPDVAIVDPDLVMSLPKSITADTGMDVLTHAIESYVSNMASDYTDGLAEKATELVIEYLLEAYEHGDNKEAREKMHNASTIAGMAFTNAFLGINHSLAHKIGAEFHLPHGRINAILLPYVIRYNSSRPTKFVSFPKYEYFIADEKYARLAKKVGLKADTTEEGINSLITKIQEMNEKLNIPKSFKDAGVDETEFLAKIDLLADRAFEDQCTTANPRVPLVSEMKQILIDSYYGNEIK